MRKLQILALLICLTAGMYSSCSKPAATTTTNTPANPYYLTASIANDNPPSFTATTVTGTNTGPATKGTVQITATNASGEGMIIVFSNNCSPGNYVQGNQGVNFYYFLTYTSQYSGTSGTLNLTSVIGTTVSGTFSFSATNPATATSVTVTNGKFNAKLN